MALHLTLVRRKLNCVMEVGCWVSSRKSSFYDCYNCELDVGILEVSEIKIYLVTACIMWRVVHVILDSNPPNKVSAKISKHLLI